MNKTELIAKVKEKLTTEEHKVTKDEAAKSVDAVLDVIAESLKQGESVKLVGFGNFEVRERAARKGVNPKLLSELKEQGVDEVTAKEQAQVEIAATKVPAFKPSKQLKDSVK